METMRQIVMQENNEKRFNRKLIDRQIKEYLTGNAECMVKINEGVDLLNAYRSKTYYDSKNARIAQLSGLDMAEVVINIFTGIVYCDREELFTSVSAKMAGRLGFSDKLDAIKTTAEMLAVLCMTDAFDINRTKGNSMVIINRLPLPDALCTLIEESQFLPPMVCEPLELVDNYSSGYLTFNDSLLLGTGNHHDGDLCLDVLNKMNKTALKLDTEFLCKCSELPSHEIVTQEQHDNWNTFKKQSYMFYTLLAQQDNQFYFTHKVDKRGRVYAQGYHVNTQGSSFKKAMIELVKEEVVTGVYV